MSIKHNRHHIKQDSSIPAWLYFALYDYKGEQKTQNIEEIALNILQALNKHYKERKALGLDIVLEPNNYDANGMYGRCPCQECCSAWFNPEDHDKQIRERQEVKTSVPVKPTENKFRAESKKK